MAFVIVGSWPQYVLRITDACFNICSVGLVLAFIDAHAMKKSMWSCIKP